MQEITEPVDEAIFHLPHRSEKRQKIIITVLAFAFVLSSFLCGTCYHFPGASSLPSDPFTVIVETFMRLKADILLSGLTWCQPWHLT